MKSTFFLLDDIRNRLRDVFTGVVFREPVNGGNPATHEGKEWYREPRFYLQNLPAKRGGVTPDGEEQGEDVPYILVMGLGNGITGEKPREHTVNVAIVFTIYDAGGNPETGTQDLFNMGDRILTALASRGLWADDFYRQVLPIKAIYGVDKAKDVYDSRWQAAGPYHGGVIMTQFTSAALPQGPPAGTVDAKEPDHPTFSTEG